MKIKALKSGKFAHPEPCRGIISVREGAEYDVDDRMWESLVECGWGEPVEVGSPLAEQKSISKMNKTELIAFAGKEGIALERAWTKAEIRKAIEAKRADPDG